MWIDIYLWIFFACISLLHIHAEPVDARRRCLIPWNWSCMSPCGCWDYEPEKSFSEKGF